MSSPGSGSNGPGRSTGAEVAWTHRTEMEEYVADGYMFEPEVETMDAVAKEHLKSRRLMALLGRLKHAD